ncbi:MAG: beta-ketoacyl synthase chain length factor [Lentimicrobiaceae bacterium]|nr:beta-ketoacyl synthase chain length factor [Lentimicrobiaceae bacterium]
MNNIYINSIKQISVQQPLVDDWFEEPVIYSEPYVRAIEPDYKQFFTPNESRRLGKILKRALLVSRQAMSESGIALPDAIITGTGLGCIENTEIFLDKLVREGEELLNPTHFMQSTHNTISSLIAIDAKCCGYNSTYAHKGISFESALQDAFMQMKRKDNRVAAALVGAHDEMTPAYFNLLKKAGYLGKPNQIFAGETAVAMMLSKEKSDKSLCEIEAVEKVYSAARELERVNGIKELLRINNIDYIMVGANGNPKNDEIYFENCAKLFPNVPLLQYKTVFGEGYTVSALGVYAAAVCLQRGEIPQHLKLAVSDAVYRKNKVSKILCYNHFEGKNHTFILLSNNRSDINRS